MRKCVALPPIEEWYEADSSAHLPNDGEAVLALAEVAGALGVVQVIFRGNSFMWEFCLGNQTVRATHWLHIGAIGIAETIEQASHA